MIQAIASAGIVHRYSAVGPTHAPTQCGVLIVKPLTFARVSLGSGFPTSPQGWPCKICFGEFVK